PPERGSGIETIADVGRNMREQWRHTRAAFRSILPQQGPPPPSDPPPPTPSGNDQPARADRRWREREHSIQDRLIEMTERRSVGWRDTWQQPDDLQQLGAP